MEPTKRIGILWAVIAGFHPECGARRSRREIPWREILRWRDPARRIQRDRRFNSVAAIKDEDMLEPNFRQKVHDVMAAAQPVQFRPVVFNQLQHGRLAALFYFAGRSASIPFGGAR